MALRGQLPAVQARPTPARSFEGLPEGEATAKGTNAGERGPGA